MNMFKSDASSPPPPTPAPPPPSTEDAAAKALAEEQAAGKIRKGQGYASTILTGGSGDMSATPTYKKTLLGE